MPEGDSALWLGTGAGLIRLGLRNHSVITYTVKDGIAHDEFNTNSTLIASDGYYYMGGIAGITRFRPEDLMAQRNEQKRIPLIVRSISVFDGDQSRNIPIDFEQKLTPIVLEPRDQLLTIDVAMTDFSNPEQNMFSFYLEGFEDQWSEPSTNHTVRYHNLEPGQYVLHAKGRRSSAVWSAHEMSLPLIVQRSFF